MRGIGGSLPTPIPAAALASGAGMRIDARFGPR